MTRRVLLVSGVVIAIVASVTWLLRRPGCSVTQRLNPDVACRVLDVRQDGVYLVEYFNADTNELCLYIQTKRRDSEIEHPSGKVKAFNPTLRENKVTFNPGDERTLLINGEVFPITPK
jgi:hypothetical protein